MRFALLCFMRPSRNQANRKLGKKRKTSFYAVCAFLFCEVALAGQGVGGGGGGCSIPIPPLRSNLPCSGASEPKSPAPTPVASSAPEPGTGRLEFATLGQDGKTLVPADSSSVLDLGEQATGGSSRARVIVVTNVGGSRVERMSAPRLEAPYSYAGESYPGESEGGDCGFALAADAHCMIVVHVGGDTGGSFEQDLEIEYSSAGLALLGSSKAVLKIRLTEPALSPSASPSPSSSPSPSAEGEGGAP